MPEPPWKPLYKFFGKDIPWTKRSTPWAMTAVKKLTKLLLMLEFVLPSACPSTATVSMSNIESRSPSAINWSLISHKNNGAHLGPWQQWKFGWDCFCGSFHFSVHVEVRRPSLCWISCPETPLQIFQYQSPRKTTERTLSCGSNEEIDWAGGTGVKKYII